MVSIVDGLFASEISGQASLASFNDRIEIQTPVALFSVRCELGALEDLSRFVFYCVRPPDNAESAIHKIVLPSGGRTAGYLFPIASFDPDSLHCPQKNANRYVRAYACAALQWLVFQGGGNSLLYAAHVDLAAGVSIAELYGTDLSIAAISSEFCREDADTQVRLVLQANGFFLADGGPRTFERYRAVPSGPIKLERFSGPVCSSGSAIERFLMLASRQDSAEASFLFYYQVIELLSDKVLERLMRKILDDSVSLSGFDVKTRVLEQTSESSRVGKLVGFASKVDPAAVESLRLAGRAILAACRNIKDDDAFNSAKVLYDVRNLIVHNQVPLTGISSETFRAFIDSVHRVVIAMLRAFPSEPVPELDSPGRLTEVRVLKKRLEIARRLHAEHLAWQTLRSFAPTRSWLSAQTQAAKNAADALAEELEAVIAAGRV